MRHVNIPVFIPHLGCPNLCVFCNQKAISGKTDFDDRYITEYADKTISDALETIEPDAQTEIAFFGGSFTGIDRTLMISLLKTAKKYVLRGDVSSIRLSTRPDYISEDILGILAEYSVKYIELGIQSMSDRVLELTRRGHTAADTERACRLIKRYRFSLIGQMMTALPGSSPADEIETAEKIVELGADGARIYPTAVFARTELAEMTKRGEYNPPDSENIISRTADVLEVFLRAKVPVIKIGLHSGRDLYGSEGIISGTYDPSVGEQIMSRVMLNRIIHRLRGLETHEKILFLEVPTGFTSITSGKRKTNKTALCNGFGFRDVKISENPDLRPYTFNYTLS
ncbi:MAG: radical SAM protein [Clostridia bacterium]|nr:radical SAM protein [Clostridia bacterium]